jgi:DNA-binding transcriptional regulator YiaG
MNAPKPTNSLAGVACRECGQGHFDLVQIDHLEKIPNDNPITVSGIWVNRCDHCGEILFPSTTVQFIQATVAESTERLNSRELERIRENLGIERQDEMSEILGLGAKTYHKWESGAQFPTRSMSFYIRVLAEYPQAFDWLRCRGWRNQNRLTNPQQIVGFSAMFPHLAKVQPIGDRSAFHSFAPEQQRINPARGLIGVAFTK